MGARPANQIYPPPLVHEISKSMLLVAPKLWLGERNRNELPLA